MTTPKDAKPTREQRRDAARAQAEKLRQEQAARERRSRNILLGVLAGVVVLVVAAGIWIYAESQKTLLDEFDGATPANSDSSGGISVGATAAGTVNEGASELQVYLDFMCPYCGQFEDANGSDLDTLRSSGDLTVTYHLLANLDSLSMGTQYSTRAANAAATVASEAPDAFVPFVEGLFAQQPEENTEGLTDDEIAQIAVDAGVPQEVADTFTDGTYNEWVAVATQQAKREGVSGTPTVKLDGKTLPQTVNFYEPGTLSSYLAEQGVGG